MLEHTPVAPNSDNCNEEANNVVNEELINGQDVVEMCFEGYDLDLEYGIDDAFDQDFGLDNGQSSVKQKAKKKVANEDPLEMSGDNEVDPPHVHTHPNFREMYHLETGYDTRHNGVFCVEWLSSKLS